MNVETISSTKGDTFLKPLKSVNNGREAYLLKVPLHITVWKYYDDNHKDITCIYGFGKKITIGEQIEGFEHLGYVEIISYLKDNKFIITFKHEDQQ